MTEYLTEESLPN